LSPGQSLALVATTGVAAAAAGALRLGRPRLGVALLVLVIAGAAGLPDGLTRLALSEYKPLVQALSVQGARLDFETSSPLGLVSVVENSAVPLRHAPGLSLNAPHGPPSQLAVFIDGDGPHAIDRFDGGRESLEYLD
ncbi:SAM-dependent methyltransferase, partial [Pelomicrobium sp. G1]